MRKLLLLAAMVVQGEIVDLTCYLGHDAKGPKHAKCGKECALRGNPVGLLTDTQLYLLVEDHGKAEVFGKLREKVGERVRVEGVVHRKAGIQALVATKATAAAK